MKKTLTKLEIKGIREEAINWLVNKRHSFTLLKDQKRTMLNQWNNPNNASVRVMYFGILIEIKRLKKLSNTELFYELEYTHKESIYVTKAIKTYSQEAESRLAKDLLDKLKLAKITKGRPEGAYKKNTIYLMGLVKKYPFKTGLDLYRTACHEAADETKSSPFYYDSVTRMLSDEKTDISYNKFLNRVDKAKRYIRQKP